MVRIGNNRLRQAILSNFLNSSLSDFIKAINLNKHNLHYSSTIELVHGGRD